jgi:hypothetical protein
MYIYSTLIILKLKVSLLNVFYYYFIFFFKKKKSKCIVLIENKK